MTTRIGDDARATLLKIWPDLLNALETGESFGPILELAGIARGSLRAYRLENPERDKEWAMAREHGGDAYADKINEIANNAMLDANSARVRIQAFQWLAAKRNPRVYNDKQSLDVNVRTVDLTAIILAANQRLAHARQGALIEGELVTPSLADLS